MIVVPWSHDQPDNGHRVHRIGAGRTIPRGKYRAARAAAEIDRLLKDPNCASAARRAAEAISAEDGVAAACDGLERALAPD